MPSSTAAVKLTSLWKARRNARLLQHPPPASYPLGIWQTQLLSESHDHLAALAQELLSAEGDAGVEAALLSSIAATHAARLIGRLLVWMQQSPAILLAPGETYASPGTYSAMWAYSMVCLINLFRSVTVSMEASYIVKHGEWLTADLDDAGLLGSMPQFMQHMLQQASQQHAFSLHMPVLQVTSLFRELSVVAAAAGQVPSVAATLKRVVMPMVQAMQQLVCMLPQLASWQGAAGVCSGSSGGNSGASTTGSGSSMEHSMSSSGSSSRHGSSTGNDHSQSSRGWLQALCEGAVETQKLTLVAVDKLVMYNHVLQGWHACDGLAAMAVQQLAAYCLAQKRYAEAGQGIQEQQHHQAAPTFAVPALPNGVFQLLPPCQEYRAAAVRTLSLCTSVADAAASVLVWTMAAKVSWQGAATQPGHPTQSPAVSAGAVQLVIHTVLLAASMLQQQQQQQQCALGQAVQAGQEDEQSLAMGMLMACSHLLHRQIRQLASHGEGLQQLLPTSQWQLLLRALAAPVQVLQLSVPGQPQHTVLGQQQRLQREQRAPNAERALLGSQLYALQAAADGLVEGAQAVNGCAGLLKPPSCSSLGGVAAAHPQAYLALVECCMRSELLQLADMAVVAELLGQAVTAFTTSVNLSETLLGNRATVRALASALASFTKRSAAFIIAGGTAQAETAGASTTGGKAVQNFPAVLPNVCAVLTRTILLLEAVSFPTECSARSLTADGSSCVGRSSSSSCSDGRVSVNSALLCIVVARSLVLLADAQAAAAAAAGTTQEQLFARSVMARPQFRIQWKAHGQGFEMGDVPPYGKARHHSVPGQWHCWQSVFLATFGQVCATLRRLGMADQSSSSSSSTAMLSYAPSSSTAQQGNSSCNATTTATINNNNSVNAGSRGSRSGDAACTYLLRLYSSSRLWASAMAAFDAKWANLCSLMDAIDDDTSLAVGATAGGEQGPTAAASPQGSTSWLAASSEHRQCVSQLYTDALSLCRTLAAAAPLPLLCNNPGCTNLSGVSEAAAAAKVCAGCHCRYCSAECQAADWRRHKRACRRMAALGDRCSW